MKSNMPSGDQVSATLSDTSKEVLFHHLNSFGNNDLEELLSDYTGQSLLITQDKTYNGLGEITAFFEDMMKHFPKEKSIITLDKYVISDELIFIFWHATTPTLNVLLATDTILIKQGKIHEQTFIAQTQLLN